MIEAIVRKIYNLRRNYRFSKIFRKYGLQDATKIKTWTTKTELETLYFQALTCKEGANIIEIGSYLGASTCYLVAGIAEKRGHLYCVDTWHNETIPGGETDTYNEFLQNIKSMQRYLTPIRIDSRMLAKEHFQEKFQMAFIDGDHSYEAVRSDFLLIDSLTEKYAKVFFHDSKAFDGVIRVIGEALANGNWNIGGSVNNLFWIIKK